MLFSLKSDKKYTFTIKYSDWSLKCFGWNNGCPASQIVVQRITVHRSALGQCIVLFCVSGAGTESVTVFAWGCMCLHLSMKRYTHTPFSVAIRCSWFPANTVGPIGLRNKTFVNVPVSSFMDERNEDVLIKDEVIITLTSPERPNNVTFMFHVLRT